MVPFPDNLQEWSQNDKVLIVLLKLLPSMITLRQYLHPVIHRLLALFAVGHITVFGKA